MSAILADEMGLGKTVQAAAALVEVLKKKGVDRALVVTPAPLAVQWAEELNRWAPSLTVRVAPDNQAERLALFDLPIPVLITTYERLRLDIKHLLGRPELGVVILDEAQRIKNGATWTSLAPRLLRRKYAWALTGTPLENHSGDLLTLADFIAPGLVHSASSRTEIINRLRPHFLRRTKAVVTPDLPPMIVQDLHLELEGFQKQAYSQLWDNRAQASNGEAGQLLALITRLKQLCNYEPETGTSSKLDALQVLLENLTESDDKVIVVSQYAATLEWLEGELSDTASHLFHGGLSETVRAKALADFMSLPGPRVLLLSLKAGGVGLNLNAASHVVIFDRWWNPAAEDQAAARGHRFGRTRPLHVIRFVVRDSIEERILDVLSKKKDLWEQYVEPLQTSVPKFNSQDLRAILDLRPELSTKAPLDSEPLCTEETLSD
jgi:SNF2 family DNA or RNA helicase